MRAPRMTKMGSSRYPWVSRACFNIPNLKHALLTQGYLLLPIFVNLRALMLGYSANIAAFYAIISTYLLSFIRRETRMTPPRVLDALIEGSKTFLMVGSTAGVIGIIIGTVTMTGVGIKFSSVVLDFSQGILPVTLLLVAIGGYIIGMGSPSRPPIFCCRCWPSLH